MKLEDGCLERIKMAIPCDWCQTPLVENTAIKSDIPVSNSEHINQAEIEGNGSTGDESIVADGENYS
jgi:hypothetical protein